MDGIRSLDIDAAPIAWREAGTGDVLLLLHGLGGTRSSWEPQLESLSDRWRCVAWDMPGYGASQPHAQLSFDGIADSIVELLDRLDTRQAHLCGLSFGGHHALHAALRHPARVRSLVLADTSSAFGIDGTDPDEWRAARLAALDAGETPAAIAERVVTAITGPSFSGRELERTIESFGRISSQGLRAACELLPQHDVRARLAAIECPTLVVVGELDEETPPQYAESIAAGIPGSRLETIPGVGHLTPAEAPAQFNQLVRSFLSETIVQRDRCGS